MIKKVLLFLLMLVAGAALSLYIQGVSIPNLITSGIQPLQPTFSQVQTAWTNLPDTVKLVTTTGIPAAFVTFFAWTKTRAMQKLEQVKKEATLQLGQLEGEKLEVNEAKAKVEGNLDAYKTRVTEQTAQITQLETEKTKLNETITQQNSTIQRLQNDLSYGQKAEKDWVTQEIKKATHVS